MPGEIVGVAGIDGNGQRELEEVLAGVRRPIDRGRRLDPPTASARRCPRALRRPRAWPTSPAIARRRRPDSRLLDRREPDSQGQLRRPRATFAVGWLDLSRARRDAGAVTERYDAWCPPTPTPTSRRSRAATRRSWRSPASSTGDPPALVAVNPTRGLDVGSARFVHERLLERRDAGAAVLLISTELDEVLSPRRSRRRPRARKRSSRFRRGATGRPSGRSCSGSRGIVSARSRCAASCGGCAPAAVAPRGGRRALARGRRGIAGLAGLRRPGRRSPRSPGVRSEAQAAWTATALLKATPLLLTGLAVAICFRCGVWNIGAEGQLLAGALFATAVATRLLLRMRRLAHRAAGGGLAGALGGALVGAIAGCAARGARRQRGDLDDHAQLRRDPARRAWRSTVRSRRPPAPIPRAILSGRRDAARRSAACTWASPLALVLAFAMQLYLSSHRGGAFACAPSGSRRARRASPASRPSATPWRSPSRWRGRWRAWRGPSRWPV